MEEQSEYNATSAPGTCQICKGAAVTRVPIRALKPQTVRRYIFGQPDSGCDVELCGVCTMLHCEETFEDDGPARRFESAAPGDIDSRAKNGYRREGDGDELSRQRETGGSYDYATALLRMLERSGYHIYLRSDGRQIILSHEDGLDRQTRRQVERYRGEITEVIIQRLWQGNGV